MSFDAIEPDSAEFIRLLKAYDAAAWRHAFPLLHLIAERGATNANTWLSVEDVEEVVSDALADLARQVHQFETWTQITAFTFVTAQRRSIDRLRQLRAQKRHTQNATQVSFEEAHEELIAMDARALAKWAEVAALVDQLVDRLGEPAASIVRSYTEEGLSYEEIARRTNRPLGTVAAIIFRSMRRLEREIGRSSKVAKELFLYLRLIL